MSNRHIRRFLWFFGWLVCLPVAGWGISSGDLGIVAISGGACLACLYFSLHKIVCPQCGNALRVIGYHANNCPKCGTPVASPA